MTTATKKKGSSPLDGLREEGGKDIETTFNPSVKLTNKAGTPGAWFKGVFVETRLVPMEKKEPRQVHVFRYIDSNPAPTILDNGKYVEVPKDECVNQLVDVWGSGQMSAFLKKANAGDTVGIEYTGKEEVDDYPQPLNQFDVVIKPA